MSSREDDVWYLRLPKSEQLTIDSLREVGFIVENRFS